MNAEFSFSGDSTDKYYRLNYCKGTIKKIETYFQDGIDDVFPIVSRFQTDLSFLGLLYTLIILYVASLSTRMVKTNKLYFNGIKLIFLLGLVYSSSPVSYDYLVY
jgi:hypothetical protein